MELELSNHVELNIKHSSVIALQKKNGKLQKSKKKNKSPIPSPSKGEG